MATFNVVGSTPVGGLAVTWSTVFFVTDYLFALPMGTDMPTTMVPAGGQGWGSGVCTAITSDTSAIYCAHYADSNYRIASDGTATSFGPAVGSSYIVSDDTYVYWADETTVGTIMKAPKAGGGAVVLARDASPTAIAIDARSVYWSDMDGYIKSTPK
jgi:hypothetical protein